MSASSNYFVRSARLSLQLNWSMVRVTSALRRTVIMAVLYLAGTWIQGPSAGYFLAVGALFGGFFDRGDTSTRVAARGTLALAGTSLVFGTLTALLTTNTIAVVLTVAVCAAASGVASAVSMTAARVLAYTAVLGVANIVAPDNVAAALEAAVLISIGVLAEAAGTALADVISGDLIERRKLATALDEVSDALLQGADPAVTAVANPHRLVAALSVAEAMVDTWNLPPDRAVAFTAVLEAAHDLRVEAIASTKRHQNVQLLSASSSTMVASAQVLAAASIVLSTQSWNRSSRLVRLRTAVAALPVAADTGLSTADALVVACTQSLGRQCEAITEKPRPRRIQRYQRTPIARTLWQAMHPGTVPGRHAVRLALAAVISSVMAIFVNDEHAAWIAITAIIVLRPDIPSTSVRTIGRIIGTVVGAAAVVALAVVVDRDPTGLTLTAVVFVVVAFTFQMANYAIFVFGVVGVIIMLNVVQSGDPLTVAEARVLDVAVGSAIAVLASWTVPIWTTSTLPQKLADYARLTGEWLGSFADDLASGVLRPDTNEQSRRRLRASVMTLRTSIARAEVEPTDRRIDVELVRAIEVSITDGVRQTLAALAPLLEKPHANTEAGGYARRASDDLLEVARILDRSDRVVAAGTPGRSESAPIEQPTNTQGDEVLASMVECERQAQFALELSRTVLV